MSDTYIPRGAGRNQLLKTVWFNLDNGAGTTIDDVIGYLSQPVSIKSGRIVYVDATTGTVAAGSVAVGTTVGGAELVAATNYENTKTVGSVTALTLKAAAALVPAGTMITVRHTGVAVTQAGQAYVALEIVVLS
jgi:hypothetical protein